MKLRAGTLIVVLLGGMILVGCGSGSVANVSSPGGGSTPTSPGGGSPGGGNPGGSGNPTPPGGGSGDVTLSSITVTGAAALDVSKSSQFTATGHYSDKSTKDLTSSVTWASSSAATASVSNSGLATALVGGSTNITATSGKVVSNAAALTVNGPLSISITPISPAITVGNTLQLKATANFADGSFDFTNVSALRWSSSNSTAAKVNTTGLSTGLAAGVATVTATLGGVSGSTILNVTSQNLSAGSLGDSYAFFLTTVDTRGQAVMVGSFTTDHNGNITGGVMDYNTAAGVSSTGPVSLSASTYTVWPDGRGEADLKWNSLTYHVAFVLSDVISGLATKGKMISFDKNNAFGTFELQTPAANLNTVTNYVFGFNGLDSTGLAEAEIGLFQTGATLGAAGLGLYDVDDNGVVDGVAGSPIPASAMSLSPVVINPVSTGNRGTATLGNANYALYTINSSKAYFIETDTGSGATALAGVAEQQTATLNNVAYGFVEPLTPETAPSDCGPNAPALEPYCNYAFLLNHTASAQNGTFEKAGQIDFCPCINGPEVGGISNDQEYEAGDNQEWGIGDGSRNFSPSGRGLFDYPVYNGSVQEERNAIAYVVTNSASADTTTGSSRFFMMSTDSGDTTPGIGYADFINAVPTDLPPAGSYTLSITNIGNANLLEVGQAEFSGAQMSGIAYVNNNGLLSTVAIGGSMIPSAGATMSGDGRGLIAPFTSTTSSLQAYSVGSQGLILVGINPDINGRMEPQ
jgi:Bacterial Ig-like domain (group 2)